MKTVDIKGKPYIEVNERLKYFRNYYAGYRLISWIHHLDDKICVIRASIQDPAGNEVATGIAREVNGSTYINKTSFVENCETSAWGRALGNFGIGIDTAVASAEEVQNAVAQQNDQPKEPAKYTKPDTKAKEAEEISKEKRAKLVEQAWFEFQTVHADVMPEGKVFKEEYFNTEWKELYKKLTAHQKKTFLWNQESVNTLAEKILPVNCLTDIKVSPDA